MINTEIIYNLLNSLLPKLIDNYLQQYKWVNITKASEMLDCSPSALRRLIKDKQLIEGVHYFNLTPGSSNKSYRFNVKAIATVKFRTKKTHKHKQ